MEMKAKDRLEPRLITFDFGDTLVTSEPPYLDRLRTSLIELGHPRTMEEVMGAYFRADIAAARDLIPRAPFSPDQFRESLSGNFFRELGLLEHAAALSAPLARRLIELRPQRVMMPGAIETLEALHAAGYPLGIISNNDGFTRKKCEAVGIDHLFIFILDSTEEGVMKPDSRIYAKGMALAGVKPFEVLHVGDLWGCDVLGARAAGFRAAYLENALIRPDYFEGVQKLQKLLDLLDLVKP